mgnify:CR=1 FL=1
MIGRLRLRAQTRSSDGCSAWSVGTARASRACTTIARLKSAEALQAICRIQGVPVEMNDAPEPELAETAELEEFLYDQRKGFDLVIGGVPCDVKYDRVSWTTKQIAVEGESLRHTRANYFIYAIPKPSSLYFHVFSVRDLIDIFNKKNLLHRADGSTFEKYAFEHKVIGDQSDNWAVMIPIPLFDGIGQNLWQFTKTLKQQVA